MKMVKLYSARDLLEAHFLAGLLESAGVKAIVHGQHLGTGRGELPMTLETQPSLWVLDEQLADAEELLHDIQQQQAANRHTAQTETDWHCGRCGEYVEPQFDVCWSCGEERPEGTTPPTDDTPTL